MLTIVLSVIFTVLGFLIWRGRYWKRNGIVGPNSGSVLFGNMFEFFIGRKHHGHIYQDIYMSYPEASYIGFYRLFNEPVLLVRNADFVKEVLVKNFHHFQDNFVGIDEKRDFMFSHDPFVARGDRWKTLRTQISQAFTPSKVKLVFPNIKEVCGDFNDYLMNALNGEQSKAIEAKDVSSKYTLNVVVSCAFGIEGNTFADPNAEISRLVKGLFEPNSVSLIQTIVLQLLPALGHLLRFKFIPKNIEEWLSAIVKKIVERRSLLKEKRNDFLQTILDLREKNVGSVTDDALLGHSLTFFIEGFETSSTLMAFALYEIAIHPEIQEKIYQEIDSVLGKEELNFTALQNLTYLDHVLLETLRLHPVIYDLSKRCTKSFELPPQFEGSCERAIIKEGTCVVIPIYAIHYDPAIYPNPTEFDPERFSEQNSSQRSKYAYLGFGEGARMCPGMRFGLLQSKAGLVSILSKFQLGVCSKTRIPLNISKTSFLPFSNDGIWLNFIKK